MPPTIHKFSFNDVERSSLAFSRGTVWRTAYQRNNKANGQKNLRCFPTCKPDVGHQNSFCGRSVRVIFNIQLNPGLTLTNVQENLICFGHFIEDEDEGMPIKAEIPEPVLTEKIRTKKNQLREYIRGRLDDIKQGHNNCVQITYDFNLDLKGWHYGFLGCKRTRNNFHKFQVYIAIAREVQPEKLVFTICNRVRSPKWRMYCRRRKDPPECKTIVDTTYEPWEELEHLGEVNSEDCSRRPLATLQRFSGATDFLRCSGMGKKGKKSQACIVAHSEEHGQVRAPGKLSSKPPRPPSLTVKRRASDCDLTVNCLSPRANYIRQLEEERQQPKTTESNLQDSAQTNKTASGVCCSNDNIERHHIRRRSEPDLSLCDIGPYILPLPPAPQYSKMESGSKSNAKEQEDSDKRFELLRAVLKEAGIPNREVLDNDQNVAIQQRCTEQRNKQSQIRPLDERLRSQAVVFLRHCRELGPSKWKVPLHVQWMKRFAPDKVDEYTQYCLFLMHTVKGFTQAIDEFVTKDIDFEDPDNGISLHFFIQSTLRRPLHAFKSKQRKRDRVKNTERMLEEESSRRRLLETSSTKVGTEAPTKNDTKTSLFIEPQLTIEPVTETKTDPLQTDISMIASPTRPQSQMSTPTKGLFRGFLSDMGSDTLAEGVTWGLGLDCTSRIQEDQVSDFAFNNHEDVELPIRLSFGKASGDLYSTFPHSPTSSSCGQVPSSFFSHPMSPAPLFPTVPTGKQNGGNCKRQKNLKIMDTGTPDENWNPEPDFDWDFDEFLTVQMGRMSIEKQ